ncbi:metallophosphoesterase [Candidatus Uabimicrobium sp. HlEnr_7]|uniref:metallophosphoesterase family protein n=1 Tax=Candidatus Uabimicrobium helgolandensis TaxID=3095367 RepID=UPI003558B536
MQFTRRKFIKAAGLTALLGPLFGRELLALENNSEQILGKAFLQVWRQTTLNKTIKFNAENKHLETSSGEDMTIRNDFLKSKLPLTKEPKSLLFFGHITDMHIIDEESPARFAVLDSILTELDISSSGFHPQEDLLFSSTDSMIRTLNRISLQSNFDFLLNTGDSIDNAHKIELDWFTTAMSGGMIDPDSGKNEDPVPGLGNDGNDPLKVQGLLSNIPFYAAVGNHDVLYQGNIPPYLREVFNAIAEPILGKQFSIEDPVGNYSNGVIVPKGTPYNPDKLKPGKIVADPRRAALSSEEFISSYINGGGERPVFGFPKSLAGEDLAYYSTKPRASTPLRLIVLDTTSRIGTAFGIIDQDQFENFLIPELEEAKRAGELVIIASHHPSNSIMTLSRAKKRMVDVCQSDAKMHRVVKQFAGHMEERKQTIDGNTFTQTLASYSNVVLHIVGHQHTNKITAIDGKHSGYWEVQTSSLIGFPQQARLFEIVYEGNAIGAIHTCVVDHESSKNVLATKCRELAHEDHSSYNDQSNRNTILRFDVPPEIAKKLEIL